jgi:hypothetical protein
MFDTPTIASSSYNTSTVPLAFVGANIVGGNALAPAPAGNNAGEAIGKFAQYQQLRQQINPPAKQEIPMAATRRLVQVFIADPNENISLADSLLYSGDQKLTDATDQELFFEIDIKDILAKHNEKRAKTIDKKVKERVEYLEPAKIRDLKMVVVNVAAF